MLGPDAELVRLQALYDEHEFSDVHRLATTRLDQRGLGSSVVAGLRGLAGLASMRIGRADDALLHLQESFRLNPSSRDVAAALGQLLVQLGKRAEASRPFEVLLVNHRDALTRNSLRTVLTHLALHYIEAGDLERARARLEEALELDTQHPVTLRHLLSAYERLNRAGDAVRVRRRLLERLPDGVEKAGLYREQGERLALMGKNAEALDNLVLSWRLHHNEALLDQVVDGLLVAGRAREAAELLGLAFEKTHDDKRPEYAMRRAGLLAEHLGRPRDAAAALELLLDRNPQHLDAFERLVGILAAVEDWGQLHDAYARMIARLASQDEPAGAVLGLLWQKLGELCHRYLNAPSDAMTALHMSTRYMGATAELDRTLAGLCVQVPDLTPHIEALSALFARAPHNQAVGERLAATLLRVGNYDLGYLVLQTVCADGSGSPHARQTLERLVPANRHTFGAPLHAGLREKYLNPAPHLGALRATFVLAWQLLGDLFARTLDDYQISERDRVDPAAPLLLNRIISDCVAQLGMDPTPSVYLYGRVNGLASAYTHMPALLISPDLTSGQDEVRLRFLVSRQLVMLQAHAVLPGMLPLAELQVIVGCLIHAVRPDFQEMDGPLADKVNRQLKRSLNAQWAAALKLAVDPFFADGRTLDLAGYLLALSMEANRTALMCCGDIGVALSLAGSLPVVTEPLPTGELVAGVQTWAFSEAHSRLRREVGAQIPPRGPESSDFRAPDTDA